MRHHFFVSVSGVRAGGTCDLFWRQDCEEWRNSEGVASGRNSPREALIEVQEARRDLNKAEQDYRDALEELSELGVLPLDPGRGTALVPFVHDGEAAWFVFDLFDSRPIRSWRYPSDPDETRRKLTAAQTC